MKRNVAPYWLSPPSTTAEPGMPQRWKWFIVLSTTGILSLAGMITIWAPSYSPVALTLVLLGVHHAAFLIVQGVGCESNAS